MRTKTSWIGALAGVGAFLVLSLGAAGPLRAQGPVDEEELARAFDMLGQLLGIPEVSPAELKRKVEDVGGLRFRRDVPLDFMSREGLARYIQELFAAEYPPAVADKEERVLRAFGFLEPGQDLREIRSRVLNENIAGFYDERPGVKKLFAISSGERLNLMNQLVLAHELRHALQDQYTSLRGALGERSDYDDRRLAALALFEGDATLVMEKYMTRGAEGSSEGMAGLLGMAGGMGTMEGRAMAEMFAGPELRGAPEIVREQLLVPYLEGRQLAGEIFRRGGFELLNQMLARPPRSMEQVLDPEKYLGTPEEPIEVSLPEANGKHPESEGRLGELYIRVLLQGLLPETEATKAAAGWGGDHYALWREGGSYRLFWRTVWDETEDAEEFYQALARVSSVRFSDQPTSARTSDAVEMAGADGSRTLVRRQGREVTLERQGIE